MKLKSALLAAAMCLLLPVASFARHNPAVQYVFFDDLHAALPASQPAPLGTIGSVVDVSWAGLAWEIENVKTTHVPLVIEFYSANPADCVRFNPTGADECTPQQAPLVASAAQFAGRVKVVQFNVQLHPAVLNGPDVRVLPTHVLIADYTDTRHYTAIKIWGLLDQNGMQQAIQDTFQIAP